MATTHQTRSRRINLRASAPQETLIRAGPKVQGVNMTDFILESACTRAEQIIADQTTFTLKLSTVLPCCIPSPGSNAFSPSLRWPKAAEWFFRKPISSSKG